jgi:predicted MFS family arabinose efflux permease
VLPGVRSHAGVDAGQLGVALLCIGAGALVTMRPAGMVIDRFGAGVLPAVVALFAACAVLPALAGSALALSGALLLLGAASGAFDVAVNAEGVRTESAGAPVLNLGHAAFSGAVVGASLLTGALRAAGAGPGVVLGAVAALLLVAAGALARLPAAPSAEGAGGAGSEARRDRARAPVALLVIGGLTALAYLVENAWQSWSALQLEITLGASAGVASLGPAAFASAAVAGRLLGQRLACRIADRPLLSGAAALAAAGTLVGALAPGVAVALAGIALAGLGTSVCAPTLISLAGRVSAPAERGRAVSIVTTIAYLGFLVGPAAVGLAADAADLRTALVLVAAVALTLAAGAWRAPVARSVGTPA